MSSESKAQKRAREATQAAVPKLEAGQEAYLNDPLVAAIGDAVMGMITQNLHPLSGQNLEDIKIGMAGQAHQGARNAFEQMMGGLAGTGNARGGAAAQNAADISAGLGNQLAQISSQLDLQSLQSMWPDILNALSAQSGVTTPRYAWDRDLSNAQLGVGSTLTQLAGQPSPASQLGQGIGGILGPIGGGIFGQGGLLSKG